MSLVLSNKGKGMQSSSEQPLVGEERYVTTRITAAKETTPRGALVDVFTIAYYQPLITLHTSKYSRSKNRKIREKVDSSSW